MENSHGTIKNQYNFGFLFLSSNLALRHDLGSLILLKKIKKISKSNYSWAASHAGKKLHSEFVVIRNKPEHFPSDPQKSNLLTFLRLSLLHFHGVALRIGAGRVWSYDLV